MARIPYIYRFYFLFLDPVMAVSGSWLIYTQPTKFLASTTPASLNHLTSGPPDELITLLLTNIASLYIFFAIAESLVLLQTQDLKIWRTILAGILVSDLGHAYAVYAADPSGVLALGSWSMEEWINNGILIFGAVLRVGFLLGVGGVKQ